MDVGIVIFPGSNCEADAYHAVRSVLGHTAQFVWHEERSLAGFDVVILPGGFSYGDYLRAGAIAATSPVVRALRTHAAQGGLVLGICNGFQILLEAGLLPGAMQPNVGGQFRCEFVYLRAEKADTPFTCALRQGDVLRLPIAHAEGRYYADPAIQAHLTASGQVVFRYCDAAGAATPESNPNGSLDGIAGLASDAGTVLGLMPHPERACEDLMGSTDGRLIFESLAHWVASGRARTSRPVEVR